MPDSDLLTPHTLHSASLDAWTQVDGGLEGPRAFNLSPLPFTALRYDRHAAPLHEHVPLARTAARCSLTTTLTGGAARSVPHSTTALIPHDTLTQYTLAAPHAHTTNSQLGNSAANAPAGPRERGSSWVQRPDHACGPATPMHTSLRPLRALRSTPHSTHVTLIHTSGAASRLKQRGSRSRSLSSPPSRPRKASPEQPLV